MRFPLALDNVLSTLTNCFLPSKGGSTTFGVKKIELKYFHHLQRIEY